MKVRLTVAVVTLALMGAVAAHAQVQPPQERINTALARARQVGIPVALLESKIAEGKAKGVSLERIAVAIERRQAALERASQAMRGQTDAATSLGVGADAIESGVSEQVLKAVADSSPRDRRNVAIAALTELVHQGQVPEAALERVRDALKRGPDALTNLPGNASNRGSGSNGQRNGQGQNQGQRQGQGQGNAGGREPGPPAGVPAPGDPPQSRKPDNNGSGGGQGGDKNGQGGNQGNSGSGGGGGQGNTGGGGQGNNGGGGGGGGGRGPTTPGRGR
jgi:hypothetical protein